MTKTEAAEIIAAEMSVYMRVHDLDDSEIDSLRVAESVSRCEHQSVPGSYQHMAALARPSWRTVRTVYRRNAGRI